MTSTTDTRLGVTRGFQLGQSGQSVCDAINKNYRLLSVLMQMTVINHAATTPPGSPADGDAYIIATGATGVWATKVNQIAAWDASIGPTGDWFYIVPSNGLRAHSNSLGYAVTYSGGAWSTSLTASVISNSTGAIVIQSINPSGTANISQRLQAGTETSLSTAYSTSKVDGQPIRYSIYGYVELNFSALGASTTTISVLAGTASPEGNVTARPGSTYHDRGGDLYLKKTGTGNTGWKKVLTEA